MDKMNINENLQNQKVHETIRVEGMSDKWPLRFLMASVIHGSAFAVWSALFLLDGIGITLNLSKIIAGGGVGTWFTLGYLLYLITGFIGMAVIGALYYFISRLLKRPIYSDKLALAHFALMNVAVVGAPLLLGYAGFAGGSLVIAQKTNLVHTTVVGFVNPIGIFVALGALSVLTFLVNFALTATRPARAALS